MTELTAQMKKVLKQMEQGAYIREERDTSREKSKWWLQDGKSLYGQVTEPMLDKLFRTGLIEQWQVPFRETTRDLFCLTDKLPKEYEWIRDRGETAHRIGM